MKNKYISIKNLPGGIGINTKKIKRFLENSENEIPIEWHKKNSHELKLEKLSHRYEAMLHEMELGNYRRKQQLDYKMRKARIRKLIKAGEIIEQAGLLDSITETEAEIAIAKIKKIWNEVD